MLNNMACCKNQTFVNRYVAHEAKAENMGAVNTQTVSTDKGMFKAFSTLEKVVKRTLVGIRH